MKVSYDRVYNYPKSSCTCYDCDSKQKNVDKGIKTNLAIRNCNTPVILDCTNRQFISQKNEPQSKSGIQWINPQLYTESYSPHFAKVKDCDNCDDNCNTCTTEQYASWDPRTWSAVHNQYLTFSRPPLESSVKLSEVYSDKLKGYGQCYQSYDDINAGNIAYYIDRSREDAYYPPNFTQPSVNVTKVVYKDPMGALKPEYQRQIPYKNPVTNPSCDYEPFALSFLKDTQTHRDDIMTGLLSKTNQQRWEPRWS